MFVSNIIIWAELCVVGLAKNFPGHFSKVARYVSCTWNKIIFLIQKEGLKNILNQNSNFWLNSSNLFIACFPYANLFIFSNPYLKLAG